MSHRRAHVAAAALVVLTAGCGERLVSAHAEVIAPTHTLEIEGIALGMHFREGGTYEAPLWEIAHTGANTVSLVVEWRQSDIFATDIAPADDLPYDRDLMLRETIRYAHRFGLDVMLFPILQVDHLAMGQWRGTLAPSDPSAWWTSYRQFILHYAALASEEGVAIYSVGSELGSMETSAEWGPLIADVRAAYGGQLVYSANWDHYFGPVFWDELDYVGVTAYYELAATPDERPSVDALVEAWTPFTDGLARLHRAVGRPIIITELGYTSQPTAAYHPWDYTADDGADLALQRDLYLAAMQALGEQVEISGMVLWNWFGHGGRHDTGYSPRNKPAEQILRRWYTAEETR